MSSFDRERDDDVVVDVVFDDDDDDDDDDDISFSIEVIAPFKSCAIPDAIPDDK